MSDWQPIATAPKDGRAIIVAGDEVGAFVMAWNPTGTNFLFAPGEIGIWEMLDGSMTWRDGEFGPSKWAPIKDSATTETGGEHETKGSGDE